MHIAIVRTIFDTAHGGAERYAVNLAQLWRDAGHEITVVCTRANEADAAGMNVLTVSRPKVLGPWKHRWFAARAGEAAKSSGADKVLCLARALSGNVLRLGDGLHRSWLGARYTELSQRKRALLNPRHRQILKLEADMFRPGCFDWYVANSAMIKRAVVHMYGVEPSRIKVVPNGVDASRFRLNIDVASLRADNRIDSAAPIILFSGMDFRRKGLIRAVEGFIDAQKTRPKDASPLYFVCVGKGNTTEAEQLLNDAGMYSQATFLPPQADIERWYALADVFVLPTLHDPSANAVTEALACGTPVITSSENGARQHIQQGVNGFVVGDVNKLGAAISRSLQMNFEPEKVVEASKIITANQNADQIFKLLEHAPETGDLSLGQVVESLRGSLLSAAALTREIRRALWHNNIDADPRKVFHQLR
ncbi:glycosyltransferase family 4 protein [Planctomycetota bacterium]|nr:glycosyltransferase family 4 protein [Planctomycetota bacterium]